MEVWYNPINNKIALWYEDYFAGFAPGSNPQPWLQIDNNEVWYYRKDDLKYTGWIYIGEL